MDYNNVNTLFKLLNNKAISLKTTRMDKCNASDALEFLTSRELNQLIIKAKKQYDSETKLIKLVNTINEDIMEKRKSDSILHLLQYSSVGNIECLEFMGIIIWDSDNGINCDLSHEEEDICSEKILKKLMKSVKNKFVL